uniref:PDZ domain-containing protein n=1 Tax=Setaria italica TaxID=4555 RepID=K3YM04_SETIT
SPLRTPRTTSSSLVYPKAPNVHESAEKIVLGAAKFVLGLSSYINGMLLKQCSGFLIDWSENSKLATVFTSAREQEYAPDAEVRVHLDDDVAQKGQLMYYHKHYGFALIGVHMDQPDLLASFSSEEVRLAQDVFVLGGESHGCCTGGPVVDFNGVVMGMENRNGLIPCSILNKCLHLWRRLGCIPRLRLGLKLSAIKFLGICPQVEKIYRMSNIVDTGLIVEEVSAGSIAENHGVRKGDIVKSLNGRCVDTTAALEHMLLSICVDHFDKGHGLDSSMDVTVGMFFTGGGVHGTIKFTAIASNGVEIFAKGTDTVSDNEDHNPTSMSPDEANEDDIW